MGAVPERDPGAGEQIRDRHHRGADDPERVFDPMHLKDFDESFFGRHLHGAVFLPPEVFRYRGNNKCRASPTSGNAGAARDRVLARRVGCLPSCVARRSTPYLCPSTRLDAR